MPFTGYDPFGPFVPGGVIDVSGGGMDPSYAWSLAPGGRFPGDDYYYGEYLAGSSRGTHTGNPQYDLPDWMTRAGKPGRVLGWHERNVQSGGAGQAPHSPGYGTYQFWSGPGAAYGPVYGPTRGLVDQGRPPGTAWDGPEWKPEGTSTSKPGKGKGKGGGGGGKFVFTPYAGINHQSQFVDMQPIGWGEQATEPTRFVPGAGSSTPRPAPAPAPGPGRPGGGGQGRRGRGGSGGRGGGPGGPVGPGRPGNQGGRPGFPGGPIHPMPGEPGMRGRPTDLIGGPGALTSGFRNGIFGGVDTNYLDMGTPGGWIRDPSFGTMNTSGFPTQTVPAPRPGESFDSYMTRLHDAGFGNADIGNLVGPGGFNNESGEWQWDGWGTGPVVRGEDGYTFARQGSPAAGGITTKPDTLMSLITGWTPTALYF
jgi:hypothetical protein